MKNLILAAVFTVFSFVSLGFIFETIADDPKRHPCPYVQKMMNSEDSSNNDIDSKKSECPYLNGKKTECPNAKGETKDSKSETCPYSGRNDTKTIKINNKVKLLEVKIS
ncbi:MAG TPA: hypothetical protein VK870_12315 [Ignavibacteriaceae bacterium]|nr:hypothetical protein [Ignavibacteriaceae bacterium]